MKTENFELPDENTLAPGTALVRTTVAGSGDVSEGEPWIFRIQEVMGYGSATPPLSVGVDLKVSTSTYFSNVDTAPGELASRRELVCLIRHQQNMGGSNTMSWSLVEVFEQQ